MTANSKSSVYKITNILNGKVYVGKADNTKQRWAAHWTLAKSVAGVSYRDRSLIHRALYKYGIDKFEFTVEGEYASAELAYVAETALIIKLKSNERKYGYNLTLGGRGGLKPAAATLDKRRAKREGNPASASSIIKRRETVANWSDEKRAEVSKNMSEGQKGRKASSETRALMSSRHTGQKHTSETKAIISEKNSGKKRSPEAIENIRRGHLDIPQSEETRKKRSDTMKGRKCSDEHINKMKEGWEKRRIRLAAEKAAAALSLPPSPPPPPRRQRGADTKPRKKRTPATAESRLVMSIAGKARRARERLQAKDV